ncbi:MAG: biopolymer transporter ExbD [Desulfomonilia bacterium]
MPGLGRLKRNSSDEIDLDMVPIMNMFLVLIPFLLMSASFFHLRAINTSVPVLGATQNQEVQEHMIKLTVIVELEEKGVRISAITDEGEQVSLHDCQVQIQAGEGGEYPLDELSVSLRHIKDRYPSSDTLIVIPEGGIVYDTIIKTMDVARSEGEIPLFEKVVLSGKVG